MAQYDRQLWADAYNVYQRWAAEIDAAKQRKAAGDEYALAEAFTPICKELSILIGNDKKKQQLYFAMYSMLEYI